MSPLRKKALTRKTPEAPKKPPRRGWKPRAPTATAKAKAAEVLRRLRKAHPEAECALEHHDAYELLVSTILSAQCTDARVNLVTPDLFARWPTPAALARAQTSELEDVIRSTGFFRNKAKNLLGAANRIVEAYGGEVPRGMADLMTLPGVARKTANVVRGVCWGLAEGVVVDTHVQRLSGRLGWSKETDPTRIEQDLMLLHATKDWIDVGHVLIFHGRKICHARKPRCADCPVMDLCPSAFKVG
jgi:endonuclease-3